MIKLYSDPVSPDSHRTRIVLAEKELPSEIVDVEDGESPQSLLDINPAAKLPTLEDRDTILFEASVVNEYLDERYPHPPLKPGSPAERAHMRLAVIRIEQELFPLYEELEKAGGKGEPKKKISDYFEALDTYLARQDYFVGDSYTLADVSLAPILWRLEHMKIDTAKWGHLEAYMDRLFERPAFKRSLSESEQMMHD